MNTPIDEVWLRHGIQANEEVASFAATNVFQRSDGTPEVDLHIFLPDTKEEASHVLHPGDEFPVRNQTWKLDLVEKPDSADWEIRLIRIS
jgi:hypothetical protein